MGTQQQLLLKACCDAVPALRAWLRAPLLPTSPGGTRSQALQHKRGCVAAVCPPRAGGNLAGRKKPLEAPGMAGIYVKLLSGIKGILSGSRYGQRGFVSMYPRGANHCAQLQFMSS